MNFYKTEAYKQIRLETELRASIRLIEIGLGELQNLGPYGGFYHLPLQLLASGFERLMKCHICYGHHEKQGTFPSFTDLRDSGHDLLQLKKTILEKHFQTKEIRLLKEDYEYLMNDSDLNRLVDILSEFGKSARYYNLDIVTGSNKPTRDVEEEWKEYETEIVLTTDGLLDKYLDPETDAQAKEVVTGMVVSILERFAGAICRQFTMGSLGQIAQQHSPAVLDFLRLYDKGLSQKDYKVETTRYASKVRNPHRRNIIDRLRTRFNQNYLSRTVTPEEYKGRYGKEWPFFAEIVTIECRYAQWCVITIGTRDYALTGSTKSRFKLENPQEGGVVKPGLTYYEFGELAFELARGKSQETESLEQS